mgnify:CR=1 FL=1
MRLEAAVAALEASTDYLLKAAQSNPEDTLAAAQPYLKQFGNVAGGFYLARGAIAAALAANEPGADKAWLEAKIAIAEFYAETYLVEAAGLTASITAGAGPLARIDPAALSV